MTGICFFCELSSDPIRLFAIISIIVTPPLSTGQNRVQRKTQTETRGIKTSCRRSVRARCGSLTGCAVFGIWTPQCRSEEIIGKE